MNVFIVFEIAPPLHISITRRDTLQLQKTLLKQSIISWHFQTQSVHLHTPSHIDLLCSVSHSTPLCVSYSPLSLSICSAESCDQKKVYTSPLHLPWDNTGREEDWKARGREERDWLFLHLFPLLSLFLNPPPPHTALEVAICSDTKLFFLHLFVVH